MGGHEEAVDGHTTALVGVLVVVVAIEAALAGGVDAPDVRDQDDHVGVLVLNGASHCVQPGMEDGRSGGWSDDRQELLHGHIVHRQVGGGAHLGPVGAHVR